jgi:hypothetical protein
VTSAATLSAGVTGLLVAARCLTELDILGWWALLLLAPLLALAPAVDRSQRLRWLRAVAWGWTLGAGLSLPLLGVSALYSWLG